jgi:hypothetical protein
METKTYISIGILSVVLSLSVYLTVMLETANRFGW